MKSSLESLRSKISLSGRDRDDYSINTKQSAIKSIVSMEGGHSNFSAPLSSDTNIISSFHQHTQLLRRGDDDEDDDDDLEEPMETASYDDNNGGYSKATGDRSFHDTENPENNTPQQRTVSSSASSKVKPSESVSLPTNSAKFSNSSSLSLPDEGSSGSREDDSTLPTLMGKYEQPNGKRTVIVMDPALRPTSDVRDEQEYNVDHPERFADEHIDEKQQQYSGRSQSLTEHTSNQKKPSHYTNRSVQSISTERTPVVGHTMHTSTSSELNSSLGEASFRPITPPIQDDESSNYSHMNKRQTQHSIGTATNTTLSENGDGSVRSFYDASYHPKRPEPVQGKPRVEAVPFNRAPSYPTTRSSQISDYSSSILQEPPRKELNSSDASKKPAKSALRPTRRYGRQAPVAADDRSAVSSGEYTSSVSRSTQSAPQGPSGGGLSYQYSSTSSLNADKKKGGARVRAVAALVCLIVSLILASLYGNGNLGIKLTSGWMRMDGKTVMSKGAGGGLPAPIVGVPAVAFNGSISSFPDLQSMHLMLPVAMENYADWIIPFPAANRTDLPVFWTIPRAGGQVITNILGQCLGLVEASGAGAGNQQPALQIYETPKGTRYVNVDTTTYIGIVRAHNLGLVDSGFADVMYTTMIGDAASLLFDTGHHGRLFAIFRDPIERAMSVYQQAKTLDPTVKLMTLPEYAMQRLVNNEMVRTLVHQNATADLSNDDLTMAMEIMRRKVVVGLVDYMDESLSRLEMYFGWETRAQDASVQACQRQFLVPSTERLRAPLPGSDAYHVLLNQNRLDIQLYEYARYLFDLQGGSHGASK